MARTTAELVGGIIEVDPTISLDPFIDTANQLVTEVCVGAGYADGRLEMIERWLAAHFYAMRDPRATQEVARGVGQSLQSAVSYGFKASHFGQQALRLDTAGGLAALDKATERGGIRTVSGTYLGTPLCESTLVREVCEE